MPDSERDYALIRWGECTKFGDSFVKLYTFDGDTTPKQKAEAKGQIEWDYISMQDYCNSIGNYFEPVCVNAWYYVVDNDMVLAWFIALGNWWIN